MRVRLFLLAVFRVILETLSPPQIGHRIPSGQRIVSRNSSASSSVLNVLVTSMRFIYLPRYKASINQSQLCVKGIIVYFAILTCKLCQLKCDSSYTTFGFQPVLGNSAKPYLSCQDPARSLGNHLAVVGASTQSGTPLLASCDSTLKFCTTPR